MAERVEILIEGKWVGPFTVTTRTGRTPDHIVLQGEHGLFEHYNDAPYNTRPYAPAAPAYVRWLVTLKRGGTVTVEATTVQYAETAAWTVYGIRPTSIATIEAIEAGA